MNVVVNEVITKFHQMEISSLSRLQPLDSPQKGTNRTIKPADRYVISYDFQQMNSHSITHNMLIGMAPEPPKKSRKDLSYISFDQSKSKITGVPPHPKKYSPLDHRDITKVYDSSVPTTLYVNDNSFQRLSRQHIENRTQHQNPQYSQYLSGRQQDPQKEGFFQKQNENPTAEEGSILANPLKETFDEEQERMRSPYYSKHIRREEARNTKNSSTDPSKKQNVIPRSSRNNTRHNVNSMRNSQNRSKPSIQTAQNWKDAPIIPALDSFNHPSNPINASNPTINKYSTLFSKAFKSIPTNKPEARNQILNSYSIKRKERTPNNIKIVANKTVSGGASEDITQNNMIKGYRMPEKIVPKVSPPPRGQSNSKANQTLINKAKINTIPDEQKLKKVSHINSRTLHSNTKAAQNKAQASHLNSRTPVNRQNNSNRLSQAKRQANIRVAGQRSNSKTFFKQRSEASNHTNNSRDHIIENERSKRQRNTSMPQDTDRTVKRQNSRAKSSLSNDGLHNVSRSEERLSDRSKNSRKSFLNAPPSPTIPRQSKEKNYKFKNWRQSSQQQYQKVKKEVKSPMIKKASAKGSLPVNNERPQISTRYKKSKDIDLDAEEENKFGLNNRKHVTNNNKKPIQNPKRASNQQNSSNQLISKRVSSRKQKENKEKQQEEEQKYLQKVRSHSKRQSNFSDREGSRKMSSASQKPSKFQPSSQRNSHTKSMNGQGQKYVGKSPSKMRPNSKQFSRTPDKLDKASSHRSSKARSNSSSFGIQAELDKQSTLANQNEINLVQKQGRSNSKRTKNIFEDNQIRQQTEQYHKTTEANNESCREQKEEKKQGVRQIQQLINENGSLSSISDSYDSQKAKKDKQDINTASPAAQTSHSPSRNGTSRDVPALIPIPQQNNLYELMKATEQSNPHQRELEPILNNVEADLSKSRQNIEQERQAQVGDSGPSIKQPGINRQQSKIDISQMESERNMGVNLPRPDMANNKNLLSPSRNENQTDYNDQQMDKIAEMPSSDHKDRSIDYFQCNLKETSKMNSTINHTKYEQVDKDTSNYSRAPILTFLYQIPTQTNKKNEEFKKSSNFNQSVKRIKSASEVDDIVFDQAYDMLMLIDPWILQRIAEPYQDEDGKTGIWLYCHGSWKLFLEDRQISFRTTLKSACLKALKQISEAYQLEPILKLISGVRIMRLKSSKKKLFGEIDYSLRKGHAVKAYTSSTSKWGIKLFEVVKVQSTVQNQNVILIKHESDKYWIKEAKFKEIFQHFLVIGNRPSHFWTHRLLTQQPGHKMVINITSNAPIHGSITLFYPSHEPSSLLLYRQLQSQVLKFMGQIEQKPNQNGNLYFEFKLNGAYSLFLQTPASCILAIESSSPLQIGRPEYIVSETLKNKECEYVELNQSKSKLKDSVLRGSNSSFLRNTNILRGTKNSNTNGVALDWLRDKFINMVVKK